MSIRVVIGSFTAAGEGEAASFHNHFNFTLSGSFTGRIQIQRKFTDTDVWNPCTSGGLPVEFTSPLSETLFECEGGVQYRVVCLACSGGQIDWRLSQ